MRKSTQEKNKMEHIEILEETSWWNFRRRIITLEEKLCVTITRTLRPTIWQHPYLQKDWLCWEQFVHIAGKFPMNWEIRREKLDQVFLLLTTDQYNPRVVRTEAQQKCSPAQFVAFRRCNCSKSWNKLALILDYNAGKTAVDQLHQNVEEFTCRRKTVRWPLVVFYNLLDVAAYNAYLLMKADDPEVFSQGLVFPTSRKSCTI